MHLYSCKANTLFDKSGDEILELFNHEILKDNELKEYFNYNSDRSSEENSWKNSIPILLNTLKKADLGNIGMIFEYKIPLESNRVDVILTGVDNENNLKAILIELKQWSYLENYEDEDDNVKWKIGNLSKEVDNPCNQMNRYLDHLKLNHSAFVNKKINLNYCLYLHNLDDKSPIFYGSYSKYKKRFESVTFDKNDECKFISFLKKELNNTYNENSIKLITSGKYIFSNIDYRCIKDAINNKRFANMTTDQQDILDDLNNKIFINNRDKNIVVISGDIGTGKSILGLEILRKFIDSSSSSDGCLFTIPSKAIKQVLAGYLENSNIVKYTNKVKEEKTDFNLVIIDEGHRLLDIKNELPIIINKSKNIVILQDDKQRIRLNEDGTIYNIEKIANKYKNINIYKYKLFTEKRSQCYCGYTNLIDKFLYNDSYDKEFKNTRLFNIQICNSLRELDNYFNDKYKKYTCKYYAPFCWKWTYKTQNKDINIKNDSYTFSKAWNPFEKSYTAKNKIYQWVTSVNDLNNLDLVGCVYTAQGLDFDYTGVIFWNDLIYRSGKWIVNLNKLYDKTFIQDIVSKYGGKLINRINNKWIVKYNSNDFEIHEFLKFVNADINEIIDLVKNIYRLLLSRSKRGIAIWFADLETKAYFEGFINN